MGKLLVTRGRQSRRKQMQKSGRKHRRSHSLSFSIYIYRVLKKVHPGLSISSKAMTVMSCYVDDLFERITVEASQLARHCRRLTLSTRNIEFAVRLVLPEELSRYAVLWGTKAVTEFRTRRRM